jgi:hypothetical protein
MISSTPRIGPARALGKRTGALAAGFAGFLTAAFGESALHARLAPPQINPDRTKAKRAKELFPRKAQNIWRAKMSIFRGMDLKGNDAEERRFVHPPNSA